MIRQKNIVIFFFFLLENKSIPPFFFFLQRIFGLKNNETLDFWSYKFSIIYLSWIWKLKRAGDASNHSGACSVLESMYPSIGEHNLCSLSSRCCIFLLWLSTKNISQIIALFFSPIIYQYLSHPGNVLWYSLRAVFLF